MSGYNPSRAARGRPPTNSGFEFAMWLFMRISGVVLVLLALGHMFIMHVLVVLAGEEISFAFVTSRWGTPFWRIYDLFLLIFALIHGVNGARVVIGDYIQRGGTRATLLTFLYLLSFIWLIMGMYVIVSFNPDGAPRVGPFS